MKNKIEIIERTLELGKTINDGLEYIRIKLNQGKIKETYNMLYDIVNGVLTIEKAIEPLATKSINIITCELKDTLDLIITMYEQNRVLTVQKIINQDLIPIYEKWIMSLHQELKGYMLS